jgi:hypothetical protein
MIEFVRCAIARAGRWRETRATCDRAERHVVEFWHHFTQEPRAIVAGIVERVRRGKRGDASAS